MRGKNRKRAVQKPSAAQEADVSLELISDKLKRLTWRHRLYGIDEKQAWHVIQRLDEMYRQIYREQEIRYQALLDQAAKSNQKDQEDDEQASK
ncbi:MAG: hypothetical protein ACOX69_07815 [Coriobacteriales bacterium]|jgi:hypothetical protein